MGRVDSIGLTLQAGDGGSPETFTDIGEIVDMPSIGTSKTTRDRTNLLDSVRQYAHGIEEPQEFTLSMAWDPDDTEQSALITKYTNETDDNYKVVCADDSSTEWAFSAKVMGFTAPYAGIDADLFWDVTFQLTSTITKS